jgi:hypothetical protein
MHFRMAWAKIARPCLKTKTKTEGLCSSSIEPLPTCSSRA